VTVHVDRTLGELRSLQDDLEDPDWSDAVGEAIRLLESLKVIYDEHELGKNVFKTSAADDAAALYEVLNSIGLEVL
jgi:hypothetical protein